MTDQELRFECLRLAHCERAEGNEVVQRARMYADFVTRKNDEDIICIARELAERVAR
jgi:hypothetical protein